MKNIKTGLLLVFLSISGGVMAQISDATHPAFHSISNAGLLTGSEHAALQVQTVNGVGYKNWFAGLGAGLDYYRFRTIPLFFDLRHSFGVRPNKPFVYADGGFTAPWVTESQKRNFVSQDRFAGRFYSDIGAGYLLRTGRRHFLILTAGYSQLNLQETVTPYQFIPLDFIGTSYPGTFTQQYDYHLKRIIIKAGISF